MDIQSITIENFINEFNLIINYPEIDDLLNELVISPSNLGESISIFKLENNKMYYGKSKVYDINLYTYWKIGILNIIENIDNRHLDIYFEDKTKFDYFTKYFTIQEVNEWEFYEIIN